MFFAVAAGCEGEETLIPDAGFAYFPLRTGIYQVYKVHEVRHDLSSGSEVLDYELRTEVVDSFPSGDNAHTFVIHRSRRFAATDAWEPVDTWSARHEANNLIVSEGNTPYVKLQFPVRAGARWNGNRYNTLAPDEYEYLGIGQSVALNGMNFENTMTVQQEFNDDRIVFYDARSEVYAAGAGLVYRKDTQLNYCTQDHCLGQQIIQDGTEFEMVIREYGIQ